VPKEHARVAHVANRCGWRQRRKDTSYLTKAAKLQLRFGIGGTDARSQSTHAELVRPVVQFGPILAGFFLDCRAVHHP